MFLFKRMKWWYHKTREQLCRRGLLVTEWKQTLTNRTHANDWTSPPLPPTPTWIQSQLCGALASWRALLRWDSKRELIRADWRSRSHGEPGNCEPPDLARDPSWLSGRRRLASSIGFASIQFLPLRRKHTMIYKVFAITWNKQTNKTKTVELCCHGKWGTLKSALSTRRNLFGKGANCEARYVGAPLLNMAAVKRVRRVGEATAAQRDQVSSHRQRYGVKWTESRCSHQ